MPSELISHWQLFNYVYGANVDSFSMALFGAGMLYNHLNPKNLNNYWHTTPNIDAEIYRDIYAHPYTTYTDVEYVANRPIRMGEELFASYGDGNDWFASRGIEFSPLEYDPNNPPTYSADYLRQNGHCMTEIEVKNSSIPLAGRGIFAKKPFKKGDLVSISPLLVVPKHDLETTAPHSVLMNYCFIIPNSDLALYPIGLGGLINHGGIHSNVEIDWYDWLTGTSNPERLSWSAEKLESNPFAPLDFQYVATKDIAAGDEILLNYGLRWEETWKEYLEGIKKYWLEFGSDGIVIGPQFRSTIDITSNITIPPHLQSVRCVGKRGCLPKKLKEPRNLFPKLGSNSMEKEKEDHQNEIQKGKEFIEKYFQSSVQDKSEL